MIVVANKPMCSLYSIYKNVSKGFKALVKQENHFGTFCNNFTLISHPVCKPNNYLMQFQYGKHYYGNKNLYRMQSFFSISQNCLHKNILLPPSPLTYNQYKSITTKSRLGKIKSCKAVLKRFRRVRGGYLKRWRPGKHHKMLKKSSWRKFRLRGSILVKRKSHLRVLNKMMYKH
nr:uncharacterized protein LOC124811527 [Hydra vulgaris]